ncbi:MAG: hypothetical protein ACM3SY_13995 [Candidatus Omnitrophota bacterium]
MSGITNEMDQLFQIRPQMKNIFDFNGTLRDYLHGIQTSIPHNSEKETNPLTSTIIHTINKETQRLLPNVSAPISLENQLSTFPIVSYADHHSLLNYALLYNSNLLYTEVIKNLKLPYAVVFASGSIPMVNKCHPRGFYFKKEKFNFFGEKQSKLPVFLFEGKLNSGNSKDITTLLTHSENSLTLEEKKFLEYLFFDCLEIEKVSKNYESFSDQLSYLNYNLWKHYFDSSIRDSLPHLIYLQSNPIISELLIDQINDPNSLISLILFDPKIRRKILDNFSEIPCCWGENMGSHLFWGIIERRGKTRVIALTVNESSNALIADDFHVPLEKESIIDALQTKKIYQTSFFDLLLMTFMGGYLTLGGFNQLEYLPSMQQTHVQTLRQIGLNDTADRFATRVTNQLICGLFPYSFDSGIDLIWHYNSRNGEFNGNLDRGLTQEDIDQTLNMKLKDMIAAAIDIIMQNT